MSNCSDDLKKHGYSLEDAYFHKVNRELMDRIEKKRQLEREQKLEAKGNSPPGVLNESNDQNGDWKQAA